MVRKGRTLKGFEGWFFKMSDLRGRNYFDVFVNFGVISGSLLAVSVTFFQNHPIIEQITEKTRSRPPFRDNYNIGWFARHW